MGWTKMINCITIKAGDFIREIKPPHRYYTVVNIYAGRGWFHLEPQLDEKQEAVLNRICCDAHSLTYDYEPVENPECGTADISDDYPSLVRNHPSKPVQNPSPYRFDLLPADAMLKIAALMAKGDAEHGRDNWKGIEASHHNGRSMAHMYEVRSLDPAINQREDHYTHAALRAIFALQMAIEEGRSDGKQVPVLRE